jgi:hypothetical protein
MNKLQLLKKQLMVQGGIAAAALAVFGGIALAIIGYANSVETQKTELTQAQQGLQGEYTNLLSQREKAKNSLETYKKLTQGRNGGSFKLDRVFANNLVKQLIEEYLCDKWSLNISPVVEHPEPEFTKTTGKVISSTMTLTFSAPSDEVVYAIMQRLSREMPGFLSVKDLKLEKVALIDNKALYMVSRGMKPEVVKAEIVYDWLGLQPNAAPQTPPAQEVMP